MKIYEKKISYIFKFISYGTSFVEYINVFRSLQIVQVSVSHHQIPGARMVTWNKFHAEDPEFWHELVTDTLCSM